MKKLIFITAVMGLSLVFCATPAMAVYYDFNTITPQDYTETDFSNLFPGISFDDTGGSSFTVQSVTLGPDFSGNAILNSAYSTPGDSTIATLDVPATFFSVTMGDYSQDSDDIFLFAYDAGNNLVDSDSYTIPGDWDGGYTLSVAGNISWVEFYGIGYEGANNVYWDNVQFNPAPVPGAVLLGILGLSVVGVKLRKHA